MRHDGHAEEELAESAQIDNDKNDTRQKTRASQVLPSSERKQNMNETSVILSKI